MYKKTTITTRLRRPRTDQLVEAPLANVRSCYGHAVETKNVEQQRLLMHHQTLRHALNELYRKGLSITWATNTPHVP